jgi:hypothetical protein
MNKYNKLDEDMKMARLNEFQIPQICLLFDQLDVVSRYKEMLELVIRYPGYICFHYQKNPSKYNISKAHSIFDGEPNCKKSMMLKHEMCIALAFYKNSELAKLIKDKIFGDANIDFKIQLEISAKALHIYDKNL